MSRESTLHNLHAAKTHLSRLVAQALRGETVIIGKAGTPLVRLVPVAHAEGADREPGGWEGLITLGPHWDAPALSTDELEALDARSTAQLAGDPAAEARATRRLAAAAKRADRTAGGRRKARNG
ncbi:MAG: type II toxin-antitoxin system prevent-host-death family antitoxin [Gemmatimonadales bacterium]|nr:type II toxin-antitoxin system prevent-host-death family antitoxin [Gemmatimonadales bacterium]